ncbi:MAG: hypothetical protein CMM01_05155 [Rhodopirellula sp.]|nr:hypothetical protein [Rhodopirellula sp.]
MSDRKSNSGLVRSILLVSGSVVGGDQPEKKVNESALHVKGTLVAGGLVQTFFRGFCLCAVGVLMQASPAQATERGGFLFRSEKGYRSPSSQRKEVIATLPLKRLTPEAQQRILSVAGSPTLYRRLPTQAIDCDPEMFTFLSRNAEVLVGLWELMGITSVQTRRTGPYQFEALDGTGTTCSIDLVYGDPNVHIFVADGSYDGKMVTKPVRGRGVFVLRSSYATSSSGRTTVTGTIDCFVKIEGLGADLIARTLSGLIGRSADNNFTETAKFMAQISQASEMNTPAMIDVAYRLPQVSDSTRQQFVDVIRAVSKRGWERSRQTRGLPVVVKNPTAIGPAKSTLQ